MLKPRLFTIASSNLKYPDVVHIADSLMISDIDNKKKFGLCSKYMSLIYENHKKGIKN